VSPITTHVLDTAGGRPAEGVGVVLEREAAGGTWERLGAGATDADGRLGDLLPAGTAPPGTYRITFDTGAYFAKHDLPAFYPQVSVLFAVEPGAGHHHVPLLLSPYGFTTYRGS
jgi:5-hydroxyisourate hydrolase